MSNFVTTTDGYHLQYDKIGAGPSVVLIHGIPTHGYLWRRVTPNLVAANREVVVSLIDEKKRGGVAMVAIVHDDEIRRRIADRIVDVTSFAAAA